MNKSFLFVKLNFGELKMNFSKLIYIFLCGVMQSQSLAMYNYTFYITREISAFGGISLALQGNGAFGAVYRAPRVLIWRRLRRR